MVKERIFLAMQEEKGIAPTTFYWRIRRYGTPYKTKDCRVKHYLNGRPAIDVAKENGISEVQFRQRMHKGWSPEAAATKPVNVYLRRKKV